jgi:hypothetical protein
MQLMGLDPKTAAQRIASIGATFAVHLGEDIRDVACSRAFMSKHYGGNTQDTYPTIALHWRQFHDMNFLYLNTEYNPDMPKVAGQNGLFFNTNPGDYERTIDDDTYEMFKKDAANQWRYLGRYKMYHQEPLAPTDWVLQSDSVCLPALYYVSQDNDDSSGPQ